MCSPGAERRDAYCAWRIVPQAFDSLAVEYLAGSELRLIVGSYLAEPIADADVAGRRSELRRLAECRGVKLDESRHVLDAEARPLIGRRSRPARNFAVEWAAPPC